MTQAFRARLEADLEAIDQAGLRRRLDSRVGAQGAQIEIDGRTYINFTSNDYLGLASDPVVVDAVRDALPASGFGAGAAALLSGRSAVHGELETALAEHTGADGALLFSSGYLANLGVIASLAGAPDFIAHDRLNHASLIDAVLASGAKHRRYPHFDIARLNDLLHAAKPARTRFIVTESLYSMDGDAAPLTDLNHLADEHDAVLYVDDAHGFGVTDAGFGAARSLSLRTTAPGPSAAMMVTFGKAFGAVGAAVLASDAIIETLRQRARTFIYDTALPPVCAVAALAALRHLQATPQRFVMLMDNVQLFRQTAAAAGVPLLDVDGPIQPIMIGAAAAASELATRLGDDGFYVRAIRPPTVPRHTARLRITLSAQHTAPQIQALVAALATHLST